MQYFPASCVYYNEPKHNAMYETMILTLDVNSFSDGRKVAERIENEKFESHTDLVKRLMLELGTEGANYDDYNIQVWTLSDFMDACNSEDINLVDTWIGYVQLKKLFS